MVGFHGWEVCIGPLNFRWRGWGHFSIRSRGEIDKEIFRFLGYKG
jgi:hypothetical protein